MIDMVTRKPMTVEYAEGVGPYLRMPYAQVDDIQRVLDEHKIYYWVRESVISVNGGPEFGSVMFGRAGNRDAVQAALDTVS